MPAGYCVDDGVILTQVDNSGRVWACPRCGRRAPAISESDPVEFEQRRIDEMICPRCGGNRFSQLRGDIWECSGCRRRLFLSFYTGSRTDDFPGGRPNWRSLAELDFPVDVEDEVKKVALNSDGSRIAVAVDQAIVGVFSRNDPEGSWRQVPIRAGRVTDLIFSGREELIVAESLGRSLYRFDRNLQPMVNTRLVEQGDSFLLCRDGGEIIMAVQSGRSLNVAPLSDRSSRSVSGFGFINVAGMAVTSLRCGSALLVLERMNRLSCLSFPSGTGGRGAEVYWRMDENDGLGRPAGLAWHPVYDYFIVADSEPPRLIFVDPAGSRLGELPLEVGPWAVAVSGDGNTLATVDRCEPFRLRLFTRTVTGRSGSGQRMTEPDSFGKGKERR